MKAFDWILIIFGSFAFLRWLASELLVQHLNGHFKYHKKVARNTANALWFVVPYGIVLWRLYG